MVRVSAMSAHLTLCTYFGSESDVVLSLKCRNVHAHLSHESVVTTGIGTEQSEDYSITETRHLHAVKKRRKKHICDGEVHERGGEVKKVEGEIEHVELKCSSE